MRDDRRFDKDSSTTADTVVAMLESSAHRDVDEVARPIRADLQRLVNHDRSPQHRAADHDTNSPHFVNSVDREVDYW